MSEKLNLAVSWAITFNNNGLHILLMLFALIYIALKKEEKVHRRLLLGYSLLFVFVYFFPPVTWFITLMVGDVVYWRMFWLLPMPVILAYTIVKMYARTQKRLARAGLLAAAVILLMVTGKVLYLEDNPYEPVVNKEKIPESQAAICDIINQNRGSEDEWALLAAPEDMVPYVMVYDASIRQVYGRRGKARSGYIKEAIDAALHGEWNDYEMLASEMRRINCNYIAFPEGEGRVEGMQACGLEVIGQVGSYVIYKDSWWTPDAG